MKLFDIVKAITNKDPIEWTEAKAGYVPYLINKALSFDKRTVHYANMMNRYHFLDHQMQCEFYQYGVDKINRPGRWIKSTKEEEAPVIAKHFNCGLQEAVDICKLLNAVQLKEILDKYQRVS